MYDVVINPIEITHKKDLDRKQTYLYEVNYPEAVHDKKQEILFYAVSMNTGKMGQLGIVNSLEITDITLFKTSKLVDADLNKPIIEEQRVHKQIEIEYYSGKKPVELYINGKQYKFKGNLRLNATSYVSTKKKNLIYKPIKLFSVSENTYYIDRKEQPDQLMTLIGCVVYESGREVDWDAFFNNRKFKKFVKSNFGIPMPKRSLHELDDLTIYNYDNK